MSHASQSRAQLEAQVVALSARVAALTAQLDEAHAALKVLPFVFSAQLQSEAEARVRAETALRALGARK